MLTKRIIPCLDIKDGKVVKGINFVGLKDVGDPIELAKKYDEQCADEVVFLDITASYEDRGIMKDIIDVFEKTNVDAALVASLFHFNEATVEDVRNECKKHGINVRRTR